MAGVKAAKPSDFTGKQREEAAEAAAEEQAKRAEQISMATQIAVESNERDVFDPSTGDSLGEAATVKVDPAAKEVVIRVVEDVNDMTFGAGTHYTFKVGQKYKVNEKLAKHLDKLGLVWGGL